MPSSATAEGLNQIHRDLIYIGQHLNDPSFIFSAGGTEKVGDVEAQIVDIAGSGINVRWLVDPNTGHVLRERYQAAGPAGPFQGETDLENWKTTDGIPLPVTHKNKQNGKLTSIVESTKVEFNPAIDPKLFDKPAN